MGVCVGRFPGLSWLQRLLYLLKITITFVPQTPKFEQLGPAFRSLQSQQAQVQIWKPAAWRPISLSMVLLCISSPNVSSSVLHACQTPVLIQQCLLRCTRCTEEKRLEEQSKHEQRLSVALWGKGMIQKWASCLWHCRAGSDLLWSVGKSVTNAASGVKGRCRGQELSCTGKSEDCWAAAFRAGAMAAAVLGWAMSFLPLCGWWWQPAQGGGGRLCLKGFWQR